MGIVSLAPGCCSSDRQWGQMEGYENINGAYGGSPSLISSKAPREGLFELWHLSGKHYDGICLCRDGYDHLISTASLQKGEKLGFRKSQDGLEACAGDKSIPLFQGDFMWRLEMTDQDKKRVAHNNFFFEIVPNCFCFVAEFFKNLSFH
jgi:hypothetical protein